MPKFCVPNLDSYRTAVHEILKSVSPPLMILLKGPLGAGKTKFVEYAVDALGGTGVSSPTFTFHQQYETPRGVVHHFDLYRVGSEEELETTGFWDVVSNPVGYILIEWPERVSFKPKNWQIIEAQIEIEPDGARTLKF